MAVLVSADTAGWLTAIFTGATALVAVVGVVVAILVYRHDRALSGTRGSVVVRPGRRTMPWSEVRPYELPDGWNRTNTRWLPLRLFNRSDSDTSVFPPEHARIGLMLRNVEVAMGHLVLCARERQQTALLVYRPDGWNRGTHFFVATWEIGSGEKARLASRVHLKEIPVDGDGPLARPEGEAPPSSSSA